MQEKSSGSSQLILWIGRPWIVADVVARSIAVFVVAAAAAWLELYFGEAHLNFLGLEVLLWTGLIFFIIWIVSIMSLLLLRATNTYVLRNDSLEIRTGILTSKSFVIAASGFADMEIVRSVSARLVNLGDIIIRTQDETGRDKRMVKIRDPLKIGSQIREVMAKPVVRIEGQSPPTQPK